MSTFTNQDQSHTADKPSCNSTSISLPTAVNLESRRSNKIQTQEQHQQQTTRKSNEIPPFDYSLLGPPPKTGFDWVKLIFRQYRALGTRYKTELIAGRTLSILVNWLPVSIYTNIQKFVQIRCPPTQMPSPPTQMMNDNKNNVHPRNKKRQCTEANRLQPLLCTIIIPLVIGDLISSHPPPRQQSPTPPAVRVQKRDRF
ncbi:uncharacterized protein FA14DRAFT_50743 [Meira miltonrushii]|uniref:Uncharacterized protein n=1 Tax=Meira miltonrushii TaxID=1280837 RepID=A0A316VEG1_9BASI|nr:uncharacterized protein FA14DRAFT_50743 [Meira miltonrushii]PWN36009.1 hypothetical protein FA14DRAFT_50743 [Meira miltonrushii]